jgi:hypothetical protein
VLAVAANGWTSPGMATARMSEAHMQADDYDGIKTDYTPDLWPDISQQHAYSKTVENRTKALAVRANDRFGNAQAGKLPGLRCCMIIRGESSRTGARLSPASAAWGLDAARITRCRFDIIRRSHGQQQLCQPHQLKRCAAPGLATFLLQGFQRADS